MSLIQSYRLRRPPLQRNQPNDTQSVTQYRTRRGDKADESTALPMRTVHSRTIVFTVRRKTPLLIAGSRSLTGSEFQTVGPSAEKARRPSVLRRYRGTIKRCRLADRRCRWPDCSSWPDTLLGGAFFQAPRTTTASLYSIALSS